MSEKKPFIKGANVKVYDNDPKYMIWNGIWVNAIVLIYDEKIDAYTVEYHNGRIESVKSENVKGWWE